MQSTTAKTIRWFLSSIFQKLPTCEPLCITLAHIFPPDEVDKRSKIFADWQDS